MRKTPLSTRYENPLKARFPEGFFDSIPRVPGVYFMRGERGEMLYVGKAACLRTRLRSYRQAKPGQVGENVVEALERVVAIDWEEHGSERSAHERELELIRALVPAFNLANAWEEEYLFIGMRASGRDGMRASGRDGMRASRHDGGALEFRVTSRQEDAEEFELFGCYARRARVKSAYSSLLRLLHAATFARERFSFPARLTRHFPAYTYELRLPHAKLWQERIARFLRGESQELIEALVFSLLENERIPEFVRPGLQDDLEMLAAFSRDCVIRAPRGLRTGLVSHAKMRAYLKKSVRRA